MSSASPSGIDTPDKRKLVSIGHTWQQFMDVAKPYWLGDHRRTTWAWLAGLLVLMAAETQFAVMLNHQTGEVASALAAQEADRFWKAVHTSLMILAFAVPTFALYYYARDAYSNHWRRWLTGRFLDGYLGNRTYFALNSAPDMDNPDQRIAEDINAFTGRSLHFLLIFIGSCMQLVAFSAVLWKISPMLVAVLGVYSIAGTFLSLWLFGTPLIRLNFWQVRREADFRFRLMRIRENAESIAFYRGEDQERAYLDQRFRMVYKNYNRLIRTQLFLNVFQRAFSQLSVLIPSVVLAGAVLNGDMEVGKAVAAGGAFVAVLGAVSLIVDNFESLSRFVAGIERLHGLSQAVLNGEAAGAGAPTRRDPSRASATAGGGEPGDAPSDGAPTASAPTATAKATQPTIDRQEGEHLELSHLSVQAPGSNRTLVNDLSLSLKPGESLLITGVSGSGKSSLLRAIAGLWNQGQGHVQHPPSDDMFFLPQRPYLQTGTLRSQLIYPSTHTTLSDDELLAILQDVQLGTLAERVGGLDVVRDWEKSLSGGEQQRLAFARVLVHKPRVAILDEATSALDDANEATLYRRLRDRGTTLISIAHRAAVEKFHTRVLRLKGGGAWEVRKAQKEGPDAKP